jgi:hypothetical protein
VQLYDVVIFRVECGVRVTSSSLFDRQCTEGQSEGGAAAESPNGLLLCFFACMASESFVAIYSSAAVCQEIAAVAAPSLAPPAGIE